MTDMNLGALTARKQQVSTQIKSNDESHTKITGTDIPNTNKSKETNASDMQANVLNQESADNAIRDLKSQADQMEANKDAEGFDMKALDDLNKQIKNAENDKTKLESEYKEMQTTAEKLETDLTGFTKQADDLKTENVDLNKEMAQLDNDILKAQAQAEADEILAPFKEVFAGLDGESTDELTPEMVADLKGKMEALQAKYPDLKISDLGDGALEVSKFLADGNMAMASVDAGDDTDEMFFGTTNADEFGKMEMKFTEKWQAATEGLSPRQAKKVSQQMWAEFEQECRAAGIDPEKAREKLQSGKFATYMFNQSGDETSGERISGKSVTNDNQVNALYKTKIWNNQ